MENNKLTNIQTKIFTICFYIVIFLFALWVLAFIYSEIANFFIETQCGEDYCQINYCEN